jgi:hypothetical protein
MAKPPYKDEGIVLTQVPDAEIQLRRDAQNMGRIGNLFGSKENASFYFTAGLMFLAMIFLASLAWLEPTMRPDIAKVFAAVVVGALGYLGGLSRGSH